MSARDLCSCKSKASWSVPDSEVLPRRDVPRGSILFRGAKTEAVQAEARRRQGKGLWAKARPLSSDLLPPEECPPAPVVSRPSTDMGGREISGPVADRAFVDGPPCATPAGGHRRSDVPCPLARVSPVCAWSREDCVRVGLGDGQGRSCLAEGSHNATAALIGRFLDGRLAGSLVLQCPYILADPELHAEL